jgi:hypothetical protein
MTMKTIKVADATNVQLDWLVAQIVGPVRVWKDSAGNYREASDSRVAPYFRPTRNWSQMGPIIEGEGIDVRLDRDRVFDPGEKVERWYASKPFDTIPDAEWVEYGSTPLIAVARCYVSSVLGEEVEVPEELI